MKRLFLALPLLLLSIGANAQFVNGQVLTATALNAALAGPNITSGTINGSVIGGINPSTGIFTNLTVTGTLTAPISIGSLAPQAANTVIANATNSTASPTAVSLSNCSGISSALNYTNGSGFSCNGSINALTLGGATFSSPGPIGSVSTSTGAFSSVNTPSAIIGGGAIDATTMGATSPSTGAFTTLSASSTISGTGFSTYLASPPAIGGTVAAAGSFTNLSATGTVTLPGGSVLLTGLATQAANTVVANVTGSTVSPTAVTLTSCSTTASAVSYTSGTGFGCNTTVNAATLGGATFAAPGPIGGTTPGSGVFTTLSASGAVSGAGFTARFASPGPIGNTAASTGAFTTLIASSSITPSSTAGIVGTTTNDNANAGSVGEYITSTVTSVSIPTPNTPANITSISLTAGDWDVWGNVLFLPAGSTVPVNPNVGINTTSATLPAPPLYFQMNGVTITAGSIVSGIAPSQRITLSSTTTVFLVAQIGFSVSTMSADGYISARRRR